MGAAKLLRGSGQVLPRARPLRKALLESLPSTTLPVSPQLSRLLPSPAFLDRAGAVGRVIGDFAYLLLLFLGSFLGFSLLRHHWPPSKV
jgi:hypothetical protein